MPNGPASAALPLTRRTIAIGGRDWVVESVDDQDALLAAGETSAQFPYGLMLWESAVALAAELSAQPGLCAGRTVLELGAGLGLAGVVAAALGGRVTQTDHDAAALAACRRTADLNGVVAIARSIADWHDWPIAERFDLILAADVGYDMADHAPLLAVVARCLTPAGRALFADPHRAAQPAFLDRAAAAGFTVNCHERPVADLTSSANGLLRAVTILDLQRR